MSDSIDLEAILAPISEDNPAGEDLRYDPPYEEIKEARRADDPLAQGDWQRDIKKADWDKVISLSLECLASRSKDLQIAAWLTEGLIKKEGFQGLVLGLQVLIGILERYWDSCHPRIEDDDLEFRAAPIEFMNEKLWVCVREVPLTDQDRTGGYSWLKWKESREVGYEADLRNRYGDTDESKKALRDERIADGKLTAEDFDAAVSLSSKEFYEDLARQTAMAAQEFSALDAIVDRQFGKAAPRLAELRTAIEECDQLVTKLLKDKGGRQPAVQAEPAKEKGGGVLSKLFKWHKEGPQGESAGQVLPLRTKGPQMDANDAPSTIDDTAPSPSPYPYPLNLQQISDTGNLEKAVWKEAIQMLETSGMGDALDKLLAASFSAPSVREKNRYRLLTARLCLRAERPDLARPVIEELYSLIEELHLERWESPLWIAEVLDTLYQCLSAGEPSDDDTARARVLFRKLCTTDVTKAMMYRS